jgi:hypothetical protein
VGQDFTLTPLYHTYSHLRDETYVFTSDIGAAHYLIYAGGFEGRQFQGFVYPAPWGCENPDPNLFDVLYQLPHLEVAESILTVDVGAEVERNFAPPQPGLDCLALVPKAGDVTAVPLYRLHDATPVEHCPEGKRCIRCYPVGCDQDGDMHAQVNCRDAFWYAYGKEEDGDGDKKICPEGFLSEVESPECDAPCSSHWERHVRSVALSSTDLQGSWDTWNSSLASIRPHRREAGNRFDDDCDGRVDELEHTYLPPDYSRLPNSVQVQAQVNDYAAAHTASYVRFDVVPLAAFADLRQLFAEQVDVSAGCDTHLVGSGSSISVQFEGCEIAPFAVYAIVPHFVGSDGTTRFRSIDATGALSTDFAARTADILYADTLIHGMTPTVVEPYDDYEQVHVYAVNQALYEWSLSQIDGLVGFQKMRPEQKAQGTKYGATYGELWCSEFASWVLDTVTSDADQDYVPHIDHEELTSVAAFWEYFGDLPVLPPDLPSFMGHADAIAALTGGIAKPGDYLAMSAGAKGSHSGLLLTLAPQDGQTRVWHVGGNESHDAVCLPNMPQCGVSAVFISVHDADDGVADGDQYHDGVGLLWFARPTPP